MSPRRERAARARAARLKLMDSTATDDNQFTAVGPIRADIERRVEQLRRLDAEAAAGRLVWTEQLWLAQAALCRRIGRDRALIEVWAESCVSVPDLKDAGNKLAAIDEYLSRTSREGRARVAAAMRRIEMRIGQLLPNAEIGSHSSASEGADLTPNQRSDFRQMAARPDVVEETLTPPQGS